ncbi:Septin-domain-containing protein [Zopfochytrium polystomum]|nr:Septin-domain-containing protein [Zopfochytrium polystomum]
METIAQRWSDPIVAFIDAQYEATLQEESKVRRNPKSPDYQTHACLYVLDAQVVMACRGLTPLDRHAFRRLTGKLNVIPVLGRSDLLTRKQLVAARKFVIDDLRASGILSSIFDEDSAEAAEARAAAEELQRMVPFAIVNDEALDPATEEPSDLDAWGLPTRKDVPADSPLGREYSWGTVEVENPEHSDFEALLSTLFASHMEELKLKTRETYYEMWRTERLLEVRNSIRGSVRQSTATFSSVNSNQQVKTRKETGLERLVRAG